MTCENEATVNFPEFFQSATGQAPYPWQERVATEGLPEVIDIETGAGKTAGVVVAWLYRLLHDPDDAVRLSTPPWLVFALPMRTLVEQTERNVKRWVEALGADQVVVHQLLGGAGRVDRGWQERPGQPTVLIATVDMVLSRQLMRGYAASRWTWPVEFGLLHAGCHIVFDEVQLLGPALATGRQLDAFRRSFGIAAPCSSTWMSATLDADRLRTVDNQEVAVPFTLDEADRQRGLARRLGASRMIEERAGVEPKALAALAMSEHKAGTLTLVMVNTVRRAQETFNSLKRLSRDMPDLEASLLHSRFRPADRAGIIQRAVVEPVVAGTAGRILVATQVVEAGVDISAATLITDAAPWSSIVQRAGRCNRAGEFEDARLLWTEAPRPEPYEKDDLASSIAALRSLQGQPVTSTDLRELGREVSEVEPVVAVLRRRDLVDLFDTSPDLVGNDIDVARFIRADGDVDVQVVWRHTAPAGEDGEPFLGGPLRADEQCRVSINQAREWLRKGMTSWVPDHLGRRGSWRRLDPGELRPGAVVVVDVAAGGYDPETGWDGSTKRPVPVNDASPWAQGDEQEFAPIDETSAGDPASFTGGWVGLNDHLADTEQAARVLLAEAGMHGLAESQLDAVVRAAALHDLGKAHPVFQDTLVRSAGTDNREAAERLVPLAKSGGSKRATHRRPHFRHELVSALLLIAHADVFLAGDVDADLVCYLVAAHHGRVRLAIRSIPGEEPPRESRGARVALGVVDGDLVPAVRVGDIHVADTTVHLDAMGIGGPGAWTTMALGLRDRPDLGVFRLATLEALVRLADWRASAAPSTTLALDTEGAGV